MAGIRGRGAVSRGRGLQSTGANAGTGRTAAAVPRKSKSQLKRESQAMQVLGRSLTELTVAELAGIPVWSELEAAIVAARDLERAALRRQVRFIARLLREGDAEPIERALEVVRRPGRREAVRHRRIERLREALIQEDEALVRVRESMPELDFQQLRQLVSAARRERGEARGSVAERRLFRFLHDSGV